MSGELYFKCRTNYFTPLDMPALEKLCTDTGMFVMKPNPALNLCAKPGQVALNAPLGWPALINVDSATERDAFNAAKHLMPLVAEGEVVVVQEIGFSGDQIINGVSRAYRRLGMIVREAHVDLNHIYTVAADLFHVDHNTICPAEY